MDYANALDNPSPNDHDYKELEAIYTHTDSTNTASSLPAEVANADLRTPAEWGELVHGSRAKGVSIYVRNFGRGCRIATHVTWVK